MPLLDLRNLTLEFASSAGTFTALDGVSLALDAGETVCLVGESGSGKTVTALAIARLLPEPPARYPAGEIRLRGRDVLAMSPRDLRAIRGRVVSYIFQEPGASLNPVLTVGQQVREALALHDPQRASEAEVVRRLAWVGIPAPAARARAYPHQLSGGMQQRVMIAMALACRPQLLVADEPTTALDVTIQAQILALLSELQRQLGMAILLITHNLGIVREFADRVAVIYAGQIVETALAATLLTRPRHPYTRALLRAVPELGQRAQRLDAIPGQVPAPDAWPSGCRFHPRCAEARPACAATVPETVAVDAGHQVRCPYALNSPAA